MPELTSANLAQAIVKYVAAQVLPALQPNWVMGNLVNRNYEPILALSGDTVNVPIPPTLVANNILEAGSVQTQNPSLGNAQIVLDTHAEATFAIPDISKALASPDVMATYLNPAAIAIAARVELDLLSQYSLFTANTAVGGNTSITEAAIDNAETALFNAKVPVAEPKFLVVSGGTYGAIRQLPRFTEYQTAVDRGTASPILTGALGRIKDFVVFRSQLVPIATTTQNFAFAQNALGLVVRRLPMPLPGTGAIAEYAEMGNFGVRVVMSYQPNTLSQQFTVDVLYGVGVLRNTFGVVVNSNNG